MFNSGQLVEWLKLGRIQKSINKKGEVVFVHYHSSSIKLQVNRIELKPFVVDGTIKDKMSHGKVKFHASGMYCPRCNRVISTRELNEIK